MGERNAARSRSKQRLWLTKGMEMEVGGPLSQLYVHTLSAGRAGHFVIDYFFRFIGKGNYFIYIFFLAIL